MTTVTPIFQKMGNNEMAITENPFFLCKLFTSEHLNQKKNWSIFSSSFFLLLFLFFFAAVPPVRIHSHRAISVVLVLQHKTFGIALFRFILMKYILFFFVTDVPYSYNKLSTVIMFDLFRIFLESLERPFLRPILCTNTICARKAYSSFKFSFCFLLRSQRAQKRYFFFLFFFFFFDKKVHFFFMICDVKRGVFIFQHFFFFFLCSCSSFILANFYYFFFTLCERKVSRPALTPNHAPQHHHPL